MPIPVPTVELYAPLVIQNQANLIPFSLIIEQGFVDSSVIGFTIEPNDGNNVAGFSTNEIIATLFANSSTKTTSAVYVPEAEDAAVRHDPFIYADVMGRSDSGISAVNLRTQSELYEYEELSNVFNIPRFTWEVEKTGEADSGIQGNVWVGTTDSTINRIEYSNVFANNVYSANTVSENYKLYFHNNNLYLSGYDNLARYAVNEYWDKGIDIYISNGIANTSEELFSWANEVVVFSTAAYSGKVIVRDAGNLDQLAQFAGFDAPFKIIWSPYHACHLVAGTSFLWQLFSDGTKKAVYGAKNYTIVDIDCSPNGRVCVLLHGLNNDVISLLDSNLYKLLVQSSVTDGHVRFCKYCKENLFYVLAENSSYTQTHYVLDTTLKTITPYVASTLLSNATTTALNPEGDIVMTYPVGGENLLIGNTYSITWTSPQNIVDLVSIELDLAGKKVDTIANQTQNTGSFDWTVSSTYAPSNDYRIKIAYVTANGDAGPTSSPLPFSISPAHAAPSLVQVNGNAIGIVYSKDNDRIIIVLQNGMVGMFDMSSYQFIGPFDSGIRNIISLDANDRTSVRFTQNDEVRMFVGSAPYLSDKWDSGVVVTNCKSMYYGGGNNLEPGGEYFVNVQIYSVGNGWSEVQTRKFTMPL